MQKQVRLSLGCVKCFIYLSVLTLDPNFLENICKTIVSGKTRIRIISEFTDTRKHVYVLLKRISILNPQPKKKHVYYML